MGRVPRGALPDDVVAAAEASRLLISRLATVAVAGEGDRLEMIADVDAHLSEAEQQTRPDSRSQTCGSGAVGRRRPWPEHLMVID